MPEDGMMFHHITGSAQLQVRFEKDRRSFFSTRLGQDELIALVKIDNTYKYRNTTSKNQTITAYQLLKVGMFMSLQEVPWRDSRRFFSLGRRRQ